MLNTTAPETSDKIPLFITEKFSTEALIKLQSEGFEKTDQTQRARALIIRSKTKITEDFLNQFPQLQCLVTCTSGFDHIDLHLTQKKNITVMYTPDANVISAAELTWGLVLACTRQIVQAHQQTKAGLWNRELFSGFELHGKTYGVIGLGRIGTRIAKMAQSFGMKVYAFDPYQEDAVFKSLALQRSSYEEVLKQADVLSFHVPLTKETRNMFNRSHMEYVQRNTIIINTSRGGVINEDDLVWALENDLIKGCGLDVFAKEPLARDSKLLKSSKVILTQHMGALTEEAFQKASEEAAQRLIDFFHFQRATNTLPLVNDWGKFSFDQNN